MQSVVALHSAMQEHSHPPVDVADRNAVVVVWWSAPVEQSLRVPTGTSKRMLVSACCMWLRLYAPLRTECGQPTPCVHARTKYTRTSEEAPQMALASITALHITVQCNRVGSTKRQHGDETPIGVAAPIPSHTASDDNKNGNLAFTITRKYTQSTARYGSARGSHPCTHHLFWSWLAQNTRKRSRFTLGRPPSFK